MHEAASQEPARVIEERPSEGLARGWFPVPGSAVLVLLSVLVLVSAGYYGLRWRRARRQR